MNKMLQRGFTLIELLVVIAIIGILAAVVLASLNDARSSGTDASVKQSMASFRSQAELVYNRSNFTYDSVCDGTGATSTAALRTAIENAIPAATSFACFDSAGAWAASSQLTTTGQFWCTDSTGATGLEVAAATTTVCP